ncbi:MAG: DegV family protein, partial [Clostridia bacterium]|nr:DegV family protein [Clostridia bacterium]
MSTKIIIDSASDISAAEAQTLGITMLSMTVTIGGHEYLDGVDLLPTQFYEKLVESDALPKTSQVTPYRFAEAIEPILAAGDEVVIITISSALSGTYAAAVQAAREHGERVLVVDSKSACIGERLLCQYALRLLEESPDMSARDLADALEAVKGRLCVMAMLNTLEYLKKGGRISSVVAFAGELIGLKPVIALADGEVALVGKARGSKNGSNLLTALVDQRGGIDFSMPFGV